MNNLDSDILTLDKLICRNIEVFDDSERGILSQNILSQLRNLVEVVVVKIWSENQSDVVLNYENIKAAIVFVNRKGEYRFLSQFHHLLQKSVSHYTINEEGSERLMLKYYEYLLRLKSFLKDRYKIEVLQNIEEFPLNIDSELNLYYEKIAEKIESKQALKANAYTDRYYIQKIKPFFVKSNVYYEITFIAAVNSSSKFDRVIAFTDLDVSKNYAVKLSISSDVIDVLGSQMEILIVNQWSVSIRPCELDNFSKIFGVSSKNNIQNLEYKNLMLFLTTTKVSISELVESDEEYYNKFKKFVAKDTKSTSFIPIIDRCRELVKYNLPGSNVVRYLLHNLNNKILKLQYSKDSCSILSGLKLNYGCIPFDNIPFNFSLKSHNPRISDLLQCIPLEGKEHELFARFIKQRTEVNGELFISVNDEKIPENYSELIKKYNDTLYYKHSHLKIKEENKQIYIKSYVDDCVYIIKKLINMSTYGVDNYKNSIDSWLKKSSYIIDCEEKNNVLSSMFEHSNVALIYGSAGTGKSTLINHLSNFFHNKKKIYLANTNPAVNNMRRKVKGEYPEFKTVASHLSRKNFDRTCDVLIIDECSTINNRDMRSILENTNFSLLVLVGDIHQIESIYFGNWFSVAKGILPKKSIYELNTPYRTTNINLLEVWKRVRELDIDILEPLVKNQYSVRLDSSIYRQECSDQIILCLNYDGLYGINNINRLLQKNNSNDPVYWGVNTYKVGDPVLFNEVNRFAPIIHNNMKGRITKIEYDSKEIYFEVEIDATLNSLDVKEFDFKLVGQSKNNNSIIGFNVNKYKNTDVDDDSFDVVVPFQIAYAISIHKAQGLEYDSVKIVITNEVEERISHNIFYTAITRARDSLKLYWSPETEKSVLNNIELKKISKDISMIKMRL